LAQRRRRRAHLLIRTRDATTRATQ